MSRSEAWKHLFVIYCKNPSFRQALRQQDPQLAAYFTKWIHKCVRNQQFSPHHDNAVCERLLSLNRISTR